MDLSSIKKKIIKRLLLIPILLAGITMAQVVVIKYFPPPVTMPMIWEWVIKKAAGHPYSPLSYHWKDLDEISPHLRKAVLAAEDQRFLTHNGFDFIEFKRIWREYRAKGRIRGGSTITMQAARSLYLIPCRNIVRKAIEAWYTIFMELFWDKRRILEVYLNCVDWGRGVVGAEAAAEKYFSISAKGLTPVQAASMAAILPSPHKRSPTSSDSYLKKRVKRIMRDMKLMPDL